MITVIFIVTGAGITVICSSH